MSLRVGIAVCAVFAALAATTVGATASSRNALVIGNSSYRPGFELRNPVADARAVAKALSDLGFSVTLVQDSDLATAQRALDAFVPTAIAGEAAVIYYAGHGATIDGRNFMLPVDFSMANFSHLDQEALDTDRLTQALASTHSQLKLLLFDACRNNPLETRGAKPLQQSKEVEQRPENMLLAFSTAQGMTATDGQGDHSPFAEGLIENIEKPDTEVDEVMRQVRAYVRDRTDGRQTVWTEGSLTKAFYLGKTTAPAGAITDLKPPEPDAGAAPVFADSDRVLLQPAQLKGLGPAKLRLARNEILARAGSKFGDPALAAHFARFAWYRPTTFDPKLGDIAEKNVALIRQYELIASAPKAGFFFVDSDRRLLTEAEVAPLSKQQLRAARNEIYARRGRKFKIKEVRDYFEQFDWYRPQFGEVELTFIEQKNVDLIRKFEK